MSQPGTVAVIIPCHNEEAAIAGVIGSMRAVLPGALIVVSDNASSDRTAVVAEESGAVVLPEPRLGKGYAVRRLFAAVEADVFVLVDGDGTYDASAAPGMVELLERECLDMVVGVRIGRPGDSDSRHRRHLLGNAFLTWIFRRLFAVALTDSLSGYRVMSRRFVKTFPSASVGFEVEADMNVHASVLGSPLREMPGAYLARAEGSVSKLNAHRDGWRILRRNLRLFRDARPVLSFSLMGLPWLMLAFGLIAHVFDDDSSTTTVAHLPSIVSSVAAFLVFLMFWVAGLVLVRISRNRDEAVRLAYLRFPGQLHVAQDGSLRRLHHQGGGADLQLLTGRD